jgi:uncharacterized OB-fold protein
VPMATVMSTPYWEGCGRSELLFQQCADCGAATHPPAVVCSACCSNRLTWQKSAGTGVVYSWTTIWRPQTPAFTVPYVAIVVDMVERWQILSNLVDCEHDVVSIDMPVVVEFHPAHNGMALPYFRPFDGGSSDGGREGTETGSNERAVGR